MLWLLACTPEPASMPVPVEPVEVVAAPSAERGKVLVGSLCVSCHGIELVEEQRLSLVDWERTLSWMEETQGLPVLQEPDRSSVLAYLAEAFGPVEGGTSEELPWAEPTYRPNPLW